jgi:FKBP-type peptidyl-prolyl cis-trans isomerase FklB
MKKTVLILATTIVTISMNAQVKKTVAKSTTAAKPVSTVATFKSNTDSASYGIGVRIAQNLKNQGFDGVNQELLKRAISDVLQNKTLAIPDSLIDASLEAYHKKSMDAKSAVAKKEGLAFLAANAKKPGVVVLPDGLQYEVIKTGADSTHPKLTDKVKCHYHGTLINGKVFDSSVDRGEPITFPLNGVIKGWQEAVQLMTVGSKWKLFIPSDLAYGDQQAGPSIAPGSTLIFTVELLGIEKDDKEAK